ncbi:MAG: hypothetical protein CMN05_11910 [Roseibacillus sp.]|jgi:hypothetical protein|nr:hypothetical protein [Roseibacillus sp.]MBP34398.1 hypothetical protein [Roseibacillus sp.]
MEFSLPRQLQLPPLQSNSDPDWRPGASGGPGPIVDHDLSRTSFDSILTLPRPGRWFLRLSSEERHKPQGNDRSDNGNDFFLVLLSPDSDPTRYIRPDIGLGEVGSSRNTTFELARF